MPVSLSEWRVRIGTFIHRIREYEVKERKERLLKERIRRLKVLCERLEAKIGDSGEESEDDKSRQDGPDRKGCPHKTLNIRSSGNSSVIKDLLTSCDQCVQDLLLASDSHIKELLTPSDTCIKQLLTPRRERLQRIQRLKVLCERLEAKIGDPGEESEDDKSRQDGLDPKGCPHKITNIQSSGNSSDIKDLLTSCDQCIQELLTASHSHIKEILTPSDTATCIKRLLTPTDSNIRHLLSLPDSCRKDQQTACDSHVKDLTVLKPNYSNIRELIIHSDSCFRELHVTADACMLSDSDVKDLLTSRDSCIQELLTPTDSYIQELVSVNFPIQEMFPSRDSYTSESLTIRDSYIKELLTQRDSYTCESPRHSYIRELLSVISHTEESLSPGDNYFQEMFSIRNSYTSESLTTGDSCIQKLLTPRDSYIQELLIQRDSYTYESLKLGDSYTNVLVPPGHSYSNKSLGLRDSYINESLTVTQGDSNNQDLLSPKDSYIQELLTPIDSYTIGPLTQGDLYVQELLTPRDSSFNKSPTPGESYVQALLTPRDSYPNESLTQGDSNNQDLLSPRDSYIRELLASRDSYTIEPLTQGDSNNQNLRSPRDTYTSESLTCTQGYSNNQDLLLPIDSYITELLAPTDSYTIEPLTQGDLYVHELLTPSDSSFNKSPTPGDSYIQALLTPKDSYTNESLTQGDSNNQDLLSPRESYFRRLLAPRDSYTIEPLTQGDSNNPDLLSPKDSDIRKLLAPPDSYTIGPITQGDSDNQDLLSPRDSYIRRLLAPRDSYTIGPITQGDSNNHDLLSPKDSYIRELLAPTDSYSNEPVTPRDSYTNKLPTLGDSYIQELLSQRDSHINDLLISTDVYANEPATPEDSYIQELLTSRDSFTNTSLTPLDSDIQELFTPRDSCTYEPLTPGHFYTIKSLTGVELESPRIGDNTISPTSIFYSDAVRHGPSGGKDVLLRLPFMYFFSGLSFCRMRRTSCTMGGFSLLYLLMILMMRSGDVETNPGPDRMVSEKEFLKLSKQIEPSFYKEVGINLDISIAQLGEIKERSQNTSDAFMTVFTRWRDQQPPGTDIRALFAEELERSDLGILSGKLLAGTLLIGTGAPVTMPGSQTQPLSPYLIKRCADDFKIKYRTTLCKIRADPLDPNSTVQLPDMYTNLVLEEEYRQRKRPLEYRDLFDLKVNGEFPKRIMVQGEAGTGKTTFCAKIAWDWINDSPVLSKFVWVLVVPFREAKQYSIGEIAKSYLSKDNPATACQITEYIRSNPRDVFIAFDGLDEFDGKVAQQMKAGSNSKCNQTKPSSPTSVTLQPERGDIALSDILCSEALFDCPVLVTSRPWKVAEISWDDSLMKRYTFMHVEGFSKENVEVYIHKYFEDDMTTAEQLIQLTKDNDIISENMASYPIYISMLCLMWRELGDEKQEKFKSFQTFSLIFDEMFEFLKVHYAQKMITDLDSPSFQAYHSQLEKLMEPVAKVAFIGLQENTLSFKEGDFEQCSDSIETACRVGVLSQEKIISSTHDKSTPFPQYTTSIFFPHKLFQEYMAGIHLASLYELDHNKFNRLIEQVVLPRKEEFRHLLYFTVSRDKRIANHVIKCMVQDTPNPKEMDFLVDVSFESQDLDTAALVRGGMSFLTINPSTTAHTIAGYVFNGLYKEVIDLGVTRRQFGPIISHDVAEMICSVPSLKDVALVQAALHSDFFEVLAKEGNKSKVETLTLVDVRCQTPASSHHLVEALCAMPNLTNLTLGGKDFQEEFYSTLNAKASTLQVQTLWLPDVRCPTSASSHHLVEALCFMPNLRELTIHGQDFQEEFYSTLNAKASTLQVQTLWLVDVRCPTSASAYHLGEALCSMPKLTDLRIRGDELQEEFYSTLNAKASTLQTKSLRLVDVRCPTAAASHHLADTLGSMPNLTDLKLSGKDFQENFYSTLNAKASTLQVQTLTLVDVRCPTSASSHHLADALGSMPYLTDLKLSGKDFQEEFYSTLHKKALTLQIQNVCMEGLSMINNDPMASRDLVRFLCILPCLTDLTIKDSHETPSWFPEDFYQEISLQGPSSKNHFFNKKLHFDERSEELRQKDLGQQREYIRHLIQLTSSEIALHPTSKAPEPVSWHQGSVQQQSEDPFVIPPDVPSIGGISGKSDKIPEVDIDTVNQEATRNETASWNRSRIMVIGPTGVGKTSLIRRLTSQEFNPKEESTTGVEHSVVTQNSVSSCWALLECAQTEITKVKSSALDQTYSIWDFGGQEIDYITHPLFLSWRSLYILVIPLHLQLRDKAPCEKQLKGSAVRTHHTILDLIHFWLMSVYTHAVPANLDSTYEPKVLFIGTCAGKEGPLINEKEVTVKFQELKDLLGSNPYWKQVLSPMCVIDNRVSQKSEVIKIQEHIAGLIKDSAYMNVPMPTKWSTILTKIVDSDQITLTLTKARLTMTDFGINDLKEVKAVLKFYHDTGHLIYHEGCKLIVLKPHRFNSIISNIITVFDDKKMKGDLTKYWTDLEEKGVLSIELIKAVWEEHKGDHDQLDDIINMMIIFDLICEIPDRPDERQFFVPCRSSPMLDKKECHGEDDEVELTIDFNHFLPDGFLHRFYVRMAKWSMERKKSIKPIFHCRQMVFYIDSHHRVVMTNEIHTKEHHEIKVKIYAVAPAGAPPERTRVRVSLNKNIIDHLHETLEDLKKLWARPIEYSVGILCPNCSEHGGKELIPIREILKDQDEFASCNIGCPVYVGDLLKAFNRETQLPSEKQGDSSISGVHVDPANLSHMTGNTPKGQLKPSRYSHGSEDEPPTKRKKWTNRQTATSNEDGRTQGDKQTISTDKSRDNFDDLLRTVATQISKDTDIDKLGVKLGFEPPDIGRYIRQNRQDHTFMGTLSMLRDWRKRTPEPNEHEELKKALIASDHPRLAELLKDDLESPYGVTRGHLEPKVEGIPNNPVPESTNEDDTRGNNQSMSHGSQDDGLLGPPREAKKEDKPTD